MLSRLQRKTYSIGVGALLTLFVVMPSAALAQDEQRSSFAASVFKGVILDPTTYAPAVIAYDATMRDWNTSQPLFRYGYVEMNSRFTVSGMPRDTPLSYQDGNRKILSDAFGNFGMSVANNVTARLFERALSDRFPNHRKLVRTLSWIERSAFASYWSYKLSADHYRQATRNQRMAADLGIR